MPPNTALEATPHSHCGFASELSGYFESQVRGASAFGRQATSRAMRQIEDFMNWLTDMDWGWWPIVSLRPSKERDIDNLVLFKISPVFGGMAALLCFALLAFGHKMSFTVTSVAVIYLVCCVAFFAIYKFTFAFFWNRRARRLRNQAIHETVA